MPVPVHEMNNLTIIKTDADYSGVPNYHTPPPPQPSYRQVQQIEDLYTCQTTLPVPATDMYPGAYAANAYNSNRIIPAYHQATCAPPVQQAYQNMVAQGGYTNLYTPLQTVGGVPHKTQAFQQYVDQYQATHPEFSTAFGYPPFAGAVPGLKNARAMDQNVALGDSMGYHLPKAPAQEGFALPSDNHPDVGFCKDCREKCPECRVNNKGLYMIIAVLVVIIILLSMYIMTRRPMKVKKSMITGASGLPRMY